MLPVPRGVLLIIAWAAAPSVEAQQSFAVVAASPLSSNQIIVTWTPIPGATPLAIYRVQQICPSTTDWQQSTTYSQIFSGLISATKYIFKVEYCPNGVNSCSISANSTARTIQAATEAPDLDKGLPQVTGVSFPSTNPRNLTLRWNTASNSSCASFTAYKVSWCKVDECYLRSMNTTTSSSMQITGLQPASTYQITVQTTNGQFSSAPLTTTQITRMGSMTATATPLSPWQILLSWPKIPSFRAGVSRYWILRSGANQEWKFTGDLSMTFSGLESNMSYTFETQYCIVTGNCSVSEFLTARTPPSGEDYGTDYSIGSVRNLSNRSYTANLINVTWTAVSGCSRYEVSWCPKADICSLDRIYVTETNATINRGIKDFTNYTVYARCYQTGGQKGPRTILTPVSTAPSSDLAGLVSTSTSNSVTLFWSPKSRPGAPMPMTWVQVNATSPWLSTDSTMITIERLTSARFYNLSIQWCANNGSTCGPNAYRSVRTIQQAAEPYDLDKSLPNPTSVIHLSNGTTWAAINITGNASLYVIDVLMCTRQVCPWIKSQSYSTNTTAATTSTVNVTGLSDLTKYNITVKPARVIDGITYKNSGMLLNVLTSPAPVTGLTGVHPGPLILLFWSPKTSNVNTMYRIQGNSTGVWMQTTVPAFTDQDEISSATKYTYRVQYCKEGGAPCSSPTNITL